MGLQVFLGAISIPQKDHLKSTRIYRRRNGQILSVCLTILGCTIAFQANAIVKRKEGTKFKIFNATDQGVNKQTLSRHWALQSLFQ